MTGSSPISVQDFIKRWKEFGAAERANYQLLIPDSDRITAGVTS